ESGEAFSCSRATATETCSPPTILLLVGSNPCQRPSMRGTVLTFAHLDVASDESCPEPPMPRAFHHEHREAAARSTTEHQRLVRQLDSGLLAPGIFERLMDVSIEAVQKVESADDLSGAVEVMQPVLQLRAIVRIAGKAIRYQFHLLFRQILERKLSGSRLDEAFDGIVVIKLYVHLACDFESL